MSKNSFSFKKDSFNIKVPLLYIGAFLVTLIVGFYFGLLISQWKFVDFMLHVMPQTKVSPADNILVLGIDALKGSKRSDTIMVVNVNRATKKIGLLSIPRDSRVNIKGHGLDKINHAYAYGGVEAVKAALSEYLQIPISYHVVLKLQGVRDMVNDIGGVDINVPKRMYYVDKAGDLYIDFQPGEQTMDGDEATSYLRFRKDSSGDIGRIGRQQQFVKSVISKMLLPHNLVKVPKLVSEMDKYVETNLAVAQILGLAVEFRSSLENGSLKVNTLPGAVVLINGIYYWKVNRTAATKMVDTTLHGFDDMRIAKKEVKSKLKLANKNLGKPKVLTLVEMKKYLPEEETMFTTDVIFDEGVTLTIEVLNGNGIPGSATEVAAVLKGRGVNVPRVDNGAHFHYEDTVLVDWKGNTAEALQLAKAMNINPAHIIIYYKPKKTIDMCLVVGKDWRNLTGLEDGLQTSNPILPPEESIPDEHIIIIE